jgi:hypothetical protein
MKLGHAVSMSNSGIAERQVTITRLLSWANTPVARLSRSRREAQQFIQAEPASRLGLILALGLTDRRSRRAPRRFGNRPRKSRIARKKSVRMSNSGAAERQVALTATKRSPAMRYVCLVYFDPRKVFNQSAEAMVVLRDSGPYNDELRASGHLVMDQALKLPDQATTVRVRDGKMSAVDGPFMETKEVLGGFVLIEARDLNEAVQVAAGIPLAKLGSIEVRPIVDFSEPRPKL